MNRHFDPFYESRYNFSDSSVLIIIKNHAKLNDNYLPLKTFTPLIRTTLIAMGAKQ